MTFTLMVVLNIVLDIGILGALAFVMTRPGRLTPHGETAAVPAGSRPRAVTERAPERALSTVSRAA
jgi:hypothetical protein